MLWGCVWDINVGKILSGVSIIPTEGINGFPHILQGNIWLVLQLDFEKFVSSALI